MTALKEALSALEDWAQAERAMLRRITWKLVAASVLIVALVVYVAVIQL